MRSKMKDKLNTIRIANALAIVTAIAYLVCILAVWIAPGLTTTIGNYLLHGVDISRLVEARSFSYSIISLIMGTIAGWLIGALFGVVYNRLG